MRCDQAGQVFAAYSNSPVSQHVHPGDVMFTTGPDWYWSVGRSAIEVICSALGLSWIAAVQRMLDLPCGHGRVARHLRAAFPDADFFCCDIDREGVDFCATEFRATPIYSEPDLTLVQLPADLDLIWVGSLFTHLDQARAGAWLAYLARHLRPHGMLVATFHGLFMPDMFARGPDIDGASLRVIDEGFRTSGWGYDNYGNASDYGFSRSHPATVVKMATGIPGTRMISYVERGWAFNHDVLALVSQDRLEQFPSD